MKAGYAPSAKKRQGNRAAGDRLSEARTAARLTAGSAGAQRNEEVSDLPPNCAGYRRRGGEDPASRPFRRADAGAEVPVRHRSVGAAVAGRNVAIMGLTTVDVCQFRIRGETENAASQIRDPCHHRRGDACRRRRSSRPRRNRRSKRRCWDRPPPRRPVSRGHCRRSLKWRSDKKAAFRTGSGRRRRSIKPIARRNCRSSCYGLWTCRRRRPHSGKLPDKRFQGCPRSPRSTPRWKR